MNSKIIIRQETQADHQVVFDLITTAFQDEEFTDHREQHLVERLRKSSAFVQELSLVAVSDRQIVGHVMLTKIQIRNKEQAHESLALAPVSVLPEFQMKGIGGLLIRYAHDKATQLGFTSVILLGHEGYYPRFGYRRADTFGIQLPFEAPPENCMAIELISGALNEANGMVEYSRAFYE